MKITDQALSLIKNNHKVKARLMLAFDRDSRTIELWFKKNSLPLTTSPAVTIIKEETGLTESQILTNT